MRKAAIVSILAAIASLARPSLPAQQPDAGPPLRLDAIQSLGFSTTYSPTSTHILIGDSEQRRIWTLGVEYSHLIHQSTHLRLDYQASLMPLYEETDPTVIGTTFLLNGQSIVNLQPPMRIVYGVHGPVGTVTAGGGAVSPIYALTGRQDTYAAAFTPLGARLSALPRLRLQPTFTLDLGFVLSARDIPIDQSSQFNFLFSFGPGLQLFTTPQASIRLEYLYRHTSNASLGNQNPGVDQAVTRLTLSRRW